MFKLPPRIVIFDTEVTTDEGVAARKWAGPNEHRELVQLGAATVETEEFAIISTFKTFVRPKINPVLSEYFRDLTGIKQSDIEKAIGFPVCLECFFGWCLNYPIYCFDKIDGSRLFDRDVLIENCGLHGLKFPFKPGRFRNINAVFVQHNVLVEQSGRAPEAFGEKPEQRPHDALNDVKGLIRGLQLLKKKMSEKRVA